MKKLVLLLLFFTLFFGFLSNAAAVTFSGNAVGSWDNVSTPPPGIPVVIVNNDLGGIARIDWGTGSPDTSYFTFDGVGSDLGDSPWTTHNELPFLIGDFTYRNGVINNYAEFGDVDLNISLNITDPTNISSTYEYNFLIHTTPNTTGNDYLDADIVTITENFSSSTFILYGTKYTLELLGFSGDGLTYTSSFNSPENGIAETGIYAKITSKIPDQVPEPATMLLFGFGLLGIIGCGRKFKK